MSDGKPFMWNAGAGGGTRTGEEIAKRFIRAADDVGNCSFRRHFLIDTGMTEVVIYKYGKKVGLGKCFV